MKKENIFDLYAAQHKDEPAQTAERMPGEVKPEDVTPAPEVTPEPEKKQETPPDPPRDPEPEQKEGGNDNGV